MLLSSDIVCIYFYFQKYVFQLTGQMIDLAVETRAADAQIDELGNESNTGTALQLLNPVSIFEYYFGSFAMNGIGVRMLRITY